MDQHVTTIGYVYISFLLFMMIVAISVFAMNVQDINRYQNYVDAQIERYGGLTPEAEERIADYERHIRSGTHQFKVEPTSAQDAQVNPFGTTVKYRIYGRISVLYMEVPVQLIQRDGYVTSQRRGVY